MRTSLFGSLSLFKSCALTLWVTLSAVACTGSVGDAKGEGDRGAADDTGRGGQGNAGGNGGVGGAGAEGPACSPDDLSASPARVWRLNALQYANTVGAFVEGKLPSSPAALKAAAIAVPFGEVDRARSFSTHAAAYGIGDQDFAQVLDASRAAAALVLKQLEMQNVVCAGDGYVACVKDLVQTRGPILFHRPMQTDEVEHYTALATGNRDKLGDQRALSLALRGMLSAPQFLFRSELGEPGDSGKPASLNPYEIASALSYSLTDGPPDQSLWDAAASGALSEREELRKHVERLLADLQGDKLARFFFEWSGYEGVLLVAKEEKQYPKHHQEFLFDDAQQFISEVLSAHGEEGFLTSLLTTQKAVVRGATAWSYGMDTQLAPDAAPQMVSLPEGQRAGLLTHPAMLVAGSHTDATDPVRRGLFVREKLLCDVVPRAEIGSIPPLPDLGPNSTVRDRLKIHIEGAGCKGCHMLMDPIGLGLESFDHLGRHRTMEAGKPVDNSGQLAGAGEEWDGPFRGAIELGEKLAASPRVQQCLSQQTFRFFMGRDDDDADACTLARLHVASKNAGDFKGLLVALFTSDAFVFRRGTP